MCYYHTLQLTKQGLIQRYLDDVALISDELIKEEQKGYTVDTSKQTRPMPQQLTLAETDTSKFLLNISGRNWDIEVYNKDSLEAIAALNLLAKKFH